MPDFTSFSVSVSGFLTGTGAKTTPTPISDPGGPPKPHFHPRISLIHGWPKSHPSLDLGFFSRESAPWCKPSPSGVPLVPPMGSESTVTPHKGPHGWGWVPVLKIEITVTKWHLATLRFRFQFTVLRENRNRNRKNHKNPETGFVPLFRPAHPKPEPRIEAPNPLVFGFGFGSTLRLLCSTIFDCWEKRFHPVIPFPNGH